MGLLLALMLGREARAGADAMDGDVAGDRVGFDLAAVAGAWADDDAVAVPWADDGSLA